MVISVLIRDALLPSSPSSFLLPLSFFHSCPPSQIFLDTALYYTQYEDLMDGPVFSLLHHPMFVRSAHCCPVLELYYIFLKSVTYMFPAVSNLNGSLNSPLLLPRESIDRTKVQIQVKNLNTMVIAITHVHLIVM